MTGAFFLTRYRRIDPEAEFIEAVKPALRINSKKAENEKITRRLRAQGAKIDKIPWLKQGFYYDAEFSLGATPEYLLGLYYLQGPLSQLTVEVLDPSGEVLDMAAAPGGKTTHIAERAKIVYALDNNTTRLASVRNNVERLGLTNVICIKKDARFVTDLKKQFDCVLLDAPCSGNYLAEEGWFDKRTIHDIKSNARKQKELLKAAIQVAKPGGKVLYSTCSLEPEEDELVIDWALRKYDVEILPIDTKIGSEGVTSWEGKDLDPAVKNAKRFWPHKTGCEGFFICLLRKIK